MRREGEARLEWVVAAGSPRRQQPLRPKACAGLLRHFRRETLRLRHGWSIVASGVQPPGQLRPLSRTNSLGPTVRWAPGPC